MRMTKKRSFIKKLLLPVLLLAVLLPLSGCKDESSKPKLIMVTEATFPPYEYRSGASITGIDPEIISIIAEELGYQLVISDMSFESIIPAVQTGKADIAASGITVTEERKKKVLFSLPYVVAHQVLIVKDPQIKTPADIKNKRIGVQHGTTGDLYVTKNIGDPQRFSNGALAIAALQAGKIDAVVLDSEPAAVHTAKHKELRILPEPLMKEEYAFAVGRHRKGLLLQINGVLQKMLDSGKIHEIREKHIAYQMEQKQQNETTHSWFDDLKDSFHTNFIANKRYTYLTKGFLTTLNISFYAVLLGIAIGMGVSVIRSTADQTGKLLIADAFCRIYLTVIRGTPVVVQLLIIYFVIFGAVDISKTFVAIIAFGINSGAYVAEIIRSGIMSIDKGQMEAGRSLGLSHWQSMRKIILPQALKNVLPALGNEFIVLLKETSISGYIALQDLTKGGDIIRSQTYDAFMPLLAVAVIYLAVVMLFGALLRQLEKRLQRNE